MPLKLKLKVASSPGLQEERSELPAPKIKIKPPSNNGIKKPIKKESKKLKLNLSSKKHKPSTDELLKGISKPRTVPKVRVKPTRVPGEGYDSEAPDVEDDPLLEQGIIIRFLPDANLDFVNNAVDSGDFTGLNVKWMTREKAVVSINGALYSARLLELPTITELYKTFDKKNIFKTMDICQILLVIRQINPSNVNPETDFDIPREMRLVHPLYQMSPKNELRPSKSVLRDGLVYPFENVNRRFRPRKVSHNVMDDIDNKVEALLRLDEEAEESHYDIIDASQQNFQRFQSPTPSAASTPVPQEQTTIDMEPGDDLEEELAKALETEDVQVGDRIEIGDKEMVVGLNEEIQEAENDAEEDEEEEDDDDEDGDDDDDDEDDEDTVAGKQHQKMLEEEIADLEKAVEVRRKGLESATHKMMKMKIQTSYNTLKASLDSKKRELSKLMAEKIRDREIVDAQEGTRAEAANAIDEDDEDGDDGEEGEGEAGEGEDEDEGDGDIDDLF